MNEFASTATVQPSTATSALLKKKELLSRLAPLTLNNEKDKEIDLADPDDYEQPQHHLISTSRRSKKSHDSKIQHNLTGFLNLKKQFEAKFSEKRKIEQAQRTEQYRNDNEDLFQDEEAVESEKEDDIEDEEAKKARREKIMKRAAEGLADEDGDDENDSDYHGDEESEDEEEGNEFDEDEEAFIDEFNKSFFGQNDTVKESTNEPEESEPSCSLPVKSLEETSPDLSNSESVPATLSQWFREESPSREEPNPVAGFSHLEATVSQSVDDNELLALCSGRFVETQINPNFGNLTETEDNDDIQPIRRTQKVHQELDTDDEDTNGQDNSSIDKTVKATENLDDEKKDFDGGMANLEAQGTSKMEGTQIRRRAILAEDDEDEDEDGNEDEDAIEDDGANDYLHDDDEEEEEVEKPEEPESEVDSDDELAVFQRAEHKRKLKLDGFVDEQAELSGSDVGSGDEKEEEEEDDYEKELGDDEAIDMDEVADQNHRLFLKQQIDADKREMRHLQEKLLADGDLAGPETNRLFRFAIKDDGDMGLGMDDEPVTIEEDDQDEALERLAKQRADIIKFQLENEGQEALDANDGDAISSAFKSVQAVVSQKATRPQRPSFSLLDLKLNVPKDSNPLPNKVMYTSTKQDHSTVKRSAMPDDSMVKKAKLVLGDVLNRMD